MPTLLRRWAPALAITTLSLAGCLAAAAAGAASGIYLTTRGAESLIEGSVDDVLARSRATMSEMNIVENQYETKNGGTERHLKGKTGDLDVTIEIRRETPTTTKVEVTAQRNLAEWDKEYAQQVLSKIVQKG